MKIYDQVINAALMILSIVSANKLIFFLITAMNASVTNYQKMGAIFFAAISIYLCIKSLTLLFYLLISIPILIVIVWNKELYYKYDKWLTYRTSFRVLFLI